MTEPGEIQKEIDDAKIYIDKSDKGIYKYKI
jgi:hypothetical protein